LWPEAKAIDQVVVASIVGKGTSGLSRPDFCLGDDPAFIQEEGNSIWHFRHTSAVFP